MLKVQVIGCGAAGNKAVIDLVESQEVNKDEMSYLLLNSTDKDIKPEYRTNAMIFGNGIGGCGKERNLGKRAILEDSVNGVRGLDTKIDYDADFVIVCGSTEGGTGSASIPIVSKYIKEVLHKHVIAVLFFGFGDDARGMQNSIEICQELNESIGVIVISNLKFLSEARGNKIKAEQFANEKFIEYVKILIGKDIRESNQNIDTTDLRKVILTPGYINIQKAYIKDLKNLDQYESKVNNDFDDGDCSMDSPIQSAKRMAVMFNVNPDAEYVDFSCQLFKDRYGTPYELFVHVQDCLDTMPYVAAIVSGQKMPIDSINDIFKDYKNLSTAVDKTHDDFFSSVKELMGNPDDAIFNMFDNVVGKPSTDSDKAAFFEEFGLNPSKERKNIPGVKDVGEY